MSKPEEVKCKICKVTVLKFNDQLYDKFPKHALVKDAHDEDFKYHKVHVEHVCGADDFNLS